MKNRIECSYANDVKTCSADDAASWGKRQKGKKRLYFLLTREVHTCPHLPHSSFLCFSFNVSSSPSQSLIKQLNLQFCFVSNTNGAILLQTLCCFVFHVVHVCPGNRHVLAVMGSIVITLQIFHKAIPEPPTDVSRDKMRTNVKVEAK